MSCRVAARGLLLAVAVTELALSQPLSDTCDASGGDTCDSGGGNTQWPPVADTRSLVQALDQKATFLVIRVDDLEDRIVEEETDGPPRSRDTRCVAFANKNPEGTGKCTLRGALELAATASAKTAVTLALRSGRFLLQATLPEVTGTVQIVGTAGREPSGKRTYVDPWSRTNVPAEVAEEDEAVDPHWQPRTGPGPGPTIPIGTLLDGGARHQILRAGRASALHLTTLRLEGGRALKESADDQRASLGGAVSSLGKLVMTNTVVHDNQAVNGGAMYTEGEFEMQSSLLQHNKASNCGGALYAQTGPRVHLDSCTIRQNHDNCGRRQTGNLGDKSGTSHVDGKRPSKQLEDGKGGKGGKDSLGGRDLGGGSVDVSGAIAQGGPLTDLGGPARHTLTVVASSDDKADAAAAATPGGDERKGSKRKGDKSGGKRSRPPPPPVACDPNGHGGARGELLLLSCPPGSGPAIGAFGSAGTLLDSLGLICEDGTSTATGGHISNGATWRFACPGWLVCTDSEPKCTDWAEEGECNANPGWMHANCRFSCGVCNGDDAPIREAQQAAAIVGLEVRAGEAVDAIRFECGKDVTSTSGSGKKSSKGGDAASAGRAALSPWYGGSGGATCELGCANGTAVHRVQMRIGGAGVGRIEMSSSACRSGVAAGSKGGALFETGASKGKSRRSGTDDSKVDGGADEEVGVTWQRDVEAF